MSSARGKRAAPGAGSRREAVTGQSDAPRRGEGGRSHGGQFDSLTNPRIDSTRQRDSERRPRAIPLTDTAVPAWCTLPLCEQSVGSGPPLLAGNVQYDSTPVWEAAVLEEIHALPRPEHRPAIDDRHRKVRLGESRPDVRRHVIRPLQDVPVQAVVLWDKTGKELLKIMLDIGVRILLDRQRRRCVAEKNGQHPGINVEFAHPVEDRTGDVEQTLTASVHPEAAHELFHLIHSAASRAAAGLHHTEQCFDGWTRVEHAEDRGSAIHSGHPGCDEGEDVDGRAAETCGTECGGASRIQSDSHLG